MCQEQINQRAVEYAQRPLKKNETPLHSEFLLSQANFINCIARTGFKVFFDCFCMLLSPHLHNNFFYVFPTTSPYTSGGPGTLAAKPALYRMLCDLALIPVSDSALALYSA